MKHRVLSFVMLLAAVLAPRPAPAPQAAAPTVKTNVDEVLLDLIVRDKKGKPVTDLKPEDISILDNGAKQTITSFRLVSGTDALTSSGVKSALDPLRQIRVVTLAFAALAEVDQRKMARTAAIDLIKGDQGTNVYYAVVVINTQLYVLQQFTRDKAALTKAIERATGGLTSTGYASESDAIQAELRRNLGGQNGADQPGNLLAAASQTASQVVNNGSDALQATLAQVMLSMLRRDAAVAAQGSRLTIAALRALVDGQRAIPGRKSVIYFTTGMRLPPELDVPFRSLMSSANRDNITFYSVDTRGVMTASQTAGAREQLGGAGKSRARPLASRQRRNQQLLRSLLQSRHSELRRQLSQDRGERQPQGPRHPLAQRVLRPAAGSPRRRDGGLRGAPAEGALRRQGFRRRQVSRRRPPAATRSRRYLGCHSGRSAAA